MDYSKFVKLIEEGEKYNVDFKIKCDAFASKNKRPNAELAKDICAMANNGYVTSYIIIGVSDDRKNFFSESNSKLTDDAIQDFCRKAIYPPPKVNLYRKKWRKVKEQFKNKKFTIIQIGPQKRQAFRLNKDFIHHVEKVCYRKNEVWIRVGTTSDLATPEEVARLVQGRSPQIDPQNISYRLEREKFASLSILEQQRRINDSSHDLLRKMSFHKIANKELSGLFSWRRFPTYWKSHQSGILLVHRRACFQKLTQKELYELRERIHETEFVKISNIPKRIKNIVKEIKCVRRLWLIPVLSNVPRKRIQSTLPEWRWTGKSMHLYKPYLRRLRYGKQFTPLPSSVEIAVIDDFQSISQFNEKLTEALKNIETLSNTIVIP